MSMSAVTDNNAETARKYIDEVWDTCYKDTEPFDKIDQHIEDD